MGYNKEKKAKKNQKQNQNLFSEKIKTGWVQKRPVLFFVFGFGAIMVLFYMLWQSNIFMTNIQPVILSVNASLSSHVLNLFGMQTEASKEMVYSSRFSVDISRGCDAIEAMALFLATTLSFPMNWKSKVIGLITGLAILFILNIMRIVTLFLAGLYFPSSFEMLHVQIWPVIIIIFSLLLWIQLIRMDRRKKEHVTN